MRHRLGYKKLNRTSEHRKALIKNMLNSLIKYEQIKTTLPKAKVLKPQADKIITLGKKNNLQNTKILTSKLKDIKSANKVKKTLSHLFLLLFFLMSQVIARRAYCVEGLTNQCVCVRPCRPTVRAVRPSVPTVPSKWIPI